VTAFTMSTDDRTWMRVDEQSAVGAVRRIAVGLGAEAGLDENEIGDLAIVATEMATNLARHADDGLVLIRIIRTGDQSGTEVVAMDRGPGISDIASASVDGHSTAGTLGIGLGAIARKATTFSIYSQVDSGTVLAAAVLAGGGRPSPWVAGLSRPMPGEEVCGDGYAARIIEGRRQVMLCDGLGHGPLAAVAARAAVAEFLAAPAGGPAAALDHIHRRIRHTRGVVGAIAEFEPGADVLRFAGVGNIAGTVIDGDQRRAMVSLPGILGEQRREARDFTYPLPAGAQVVLHSDGLTDRWSLGAYPGLTAQAPVVVAATLLRDAGKRRDDAAVLVAMAS
jgi:anti-sigma regulatory factor (Ser/Thr protein kinase)